MKRRLDEQLGSFVSKHGDLALERIDAQETDFQTIIDSIQSIPMLTEKKMVVIRDLGSSKQATEQIEQIIAAAGTTTEVVIYETSIDKRTGYFKTLREHTKLEEHGELDGRELATWLVAESKKRGGNIGLSDAYYLIERVGSDQYLLFNELNKLIAYQPKITRGTIELLTDQAPHSRVFDLLDAAFSGNKKKALSLYEQQRAQRVEPQAIMAMITWQLHLLATVKYAGERPVDSIAADMNMKSFPISKAAGLAAKLSEDKLKNMIDEAFSIDWKSKTIAIDLDEALKTYIATM